MSNNYKFTKEHEWVNVENNVASVGISDYAQKELGDVVYVELPTVGDSFSQGDTCSNIESVKAVNDIYCPLSGKIVEVNQELEDSPELVNQDAMGKGWIFKVKLENLLVLDELMDQAAYNDYLKGISEE